MIRKQKRRFLISLILTGLYGFFMAMVGVASTGTIHPVPMVLSILFVSTVILTTLVGMVWNYSLSLRTDQMQDQQEQYGIGKAKKRKRTAIDDVLVDLSDDDLIKLRERLQAGDVDDVDLYDQLVGEDGELVHYN